MSSSENNAAAVLWILLVAVIGVQIHHSIALWDGYGGQMQLNALVIEVGDV